MFHFLVTHHSEKNPFTELIRSQVPYLIPSGTVISVWTALLINFINITTLFVWNYQDVFISVMSIGLSTLFKLYNAELSKAQAV